MVSAAGGGGVGHVSGAWLEGFGVGTPKPQPAFRPARRPALPAWLHLPLELGSAPSAQGSGPCPSGSPRAPIWLPAARLVPGCDINYPE